MELQLFPTAQNTLWSFLYFSPMMCRFHQHAGPYTEAKNESTVAKNVLRVNIRFLCLCHKVN